MTALDTQGARSRGQSRKAAASGWIGSALEYYDFFIYATASSLVFPQIFFPSQNPRTAIVASPSLGGYPLGDAAAYSVGGQFMIQLTAVGIAVVWSGVVALVAMLIVKAIFGGARVSESSESDGLDLSSHGERAYNP